MAWHCLNCDSVSLLAPIYKGTLAREHSADSAIAAVETVSSIQVPAAAAAMRSDENVVTGGAGAVAGFKCYLCMYRTKPAAQILAGTTASSTLADETPQPQRCRHHHHMRMRAKHLRFPLMMTTEQQQPQPQTQMHGRQHITPVQYQQQQLHNHQHNSLYQALPSANRGLTQNPQPSMYAQQKSFDDARPTYGTPPGSEGSSGLYYSNRRINKSLSSITDFVNAAGGGANGDRHHPLMMGSEFYDTIFGERVVGMQPQQQEQQLLKGQRTLLRRSQSRGSEVSASSPCGATAFNEWPTLTLQSPTAQAVVQPTATPTSIYEYGRTKSPAGDSIGTGHFTITTLSRSGDNSHSTTASKRSLPRNGGVFVAVGSWSVAVPVALPTPSTPVPVAATMTPTATVATPIKATVTASSPGQTKQDTLGYEILKNPYATGATNGFYENQPQLVQPQHQPQQPQNAQKQQNLPPIEPIYAVVNKMNQSRNKSTPMLGSNTQHNRAFDALYASLDRTEANIQSKQPIQIPVDGDQVDGSSASTASAAAAADDSAVSQFTISSGVQKPGSETSDIYAKVWKGPRKPLDLQRK